MSLSGWWGRRTIHQKVFAILILMLLPVSLALLVHIEVIEQLRIVQYRHQQTILARDGVRELRRLAVDLEDSFRDYLLTRDASALSETANDEREVSQIEAPLLSLISDQPVLEREVRTAGEQLKAFLASKRDLIGRIEAGDSVAVSRDVSSPEGLLLSKSIRARLRGLEDRLDAELANVARIEGDLAEQAFRGLVAVVLAAVGLGGVGAVLLSRSVIQRIRALQAAVGRFAETGNERDLHITTGEPPDEIACLIRTVRAMGQRIGQHIRELETLSAIGHDINTLSRDGLEGVLRRITDHAVDLLGADLCLVMLRNEQMGCWIIEAASGEWNERLHKSVMLWEEFPISAQAFETQQPAIGMNLRRDARPETKRRNVIGDSMLAVPLLSRTGPFGVLALLVEHCVPAEMWNIELAKGLAEEAAIAIANARLYEEVQRQGKGAENHIGELRAVAETMAHDLKAPGERIEGLARLILEDTETRLSEAAMRWLTLIEENGADLRRRIQQVLAIARVGANSTAVEVVDPGAVLHDLLEARSTELAAHRVRVELEPDMPLLACHAAYLRQVFDNLIGNALAAVRGRDDPVISIGWNRRSEYVSFAVADNGPGIPQEDRARVFDPFVRLHAGETPGSGIGLTIVKRIVELYGGRIWIETSSMGGCAVLFTMPVWADLRTGSSQPKGESAEPLLWSYGTH
ncbi:ATP-binding protein [Candidatus Nitrospira bockiana]